MRKGSPVPADRDESLAAHGYCRVNERCGRVERLPDLGIARRIAGLGELAAVFVDERDSPTDEADGWVLRQVGELNRKPVRLGNIVGVESRDQR